MSGARFKGVTSIDDMLGWQSDSFKQLLQLDSNGISAFTMEQIRAKAATLGLTDSLAAQAIALASDADFTAKAATGKLTFGKAFSDSSLDVEQFGKLIQNSGKISSKEIEALTNAASRGTDAYKGAIKNVLSDNSDLANSFIVLESTATTSTGKLGNTFKGLAASFKSFFTSVPGILTLVGVGITAAVAAFDYFYESYDEALEKAAASASNAETERTNLSNIQTELDETGNKIDEIQAKGPLTISDENELAKLQAQNSELERQLEIQQKITDAANTEASNDAINALDKKDTSVASLYNFDGSKTPEWMAWLSGGVYSENGFSTTPVERLTDAEALDANIEKIDEFQKKIKELKNQQASSDDSKQIKKWQSQIDQYQDAIDDLESDSATRAQNIQTQLDNISDKSSDVYKENYNALTEWTNRGLSNQEKAINSLNAYFDGSNGKNFIKQRLLDAAKSGQNLEEVLNSLGIELSDLGSGVTNDNLTRYFNELTTSAEEAAEAVNSVDGSFEGVQAAFESENQGAEWDAMSSNIESALELLKQGRVGTDDFQTVAAWLSPTKIDEDAFKYDAEAYVDAWDKAYKKVKDWFDSENPIDSMWSFANDLEDEGIAKITKTADGGLSEIIPKFKTTAEAAEELGVGVNAVEAAMHKLEEYGFEFDDVMFSGEELDRYESALTNIKTLYESMDDGDAKDRLGGLIENWDSELEKYQNDLSLLTEDQIVHIEFEYDLASIQQQIDQVMSLINNGDASVENYAQVLAGNQQYIQTAESGVGFDNEGVKIPVEYVANEDTIATLQEQLKSATNEEDKIAIQAQIVNLQEVQKDLLNAFSTAHPEINADSSIDEINSAWNDFVNTAEGQEIIANIVAQGDEAKQAVADILGIDVDDINIPVKADTSDAEREINGLTSKDNKTITMDIEASTDDVEYALNQLQQGQTLIFTAEVDGKENGVSASFDETGKIVYTAEIDGVETTLEKITNEDGTVTYRADYAQMVDNLDVEATVDYLLGEQESPEVKEAFVDYIKNNQQDPELRQALVDYIKGGQDDPDAKQALLDYIKNHQDKADDQDAIVNYFRGQQVPPVDDSAGVYYYLSGQEGPADKVASVVYKVAGVVGNAASAALSAAGVGGLTGTAHLSGSLQGLYPIPQLSGRALAMGTLQDGSWLDPRWRTKHSEVALTGEEGQELVVTRANRWFTVGDRGAEFAKIPQGSIIFDAHQTKELLSKGKINSRGTAMIGGTAYATGGYLPNPGTKGWGYGTSGSSKSSSSSSKKSSSSPSKSKSSSTKSAQKAADTAKEAADKFEESFDQIEILLDRMDRSLQKLTDSIETYSYDLSKQSSISDKAMNQIRSNLTTLQSAYNRYIKEANSVGLSDSWKRIVQSGKLDITTITDESLMDKINDYQDWWKISRQCKIFLMLGTPESLIYHNVVMKYGQA